MSAYLPSDHTFALCAYGESPFLEDCAASLLAQSVKSNILISTSTPNAHIKDVARKFNLPLCINEGEPGIAHDWNCAVAHCSTPLVTIAHQDDVYLPYYSCRVLEAVNSSPHPLIAFTDYGELRNGSPVDDSRLLNVKRLLLSPLKRKKLQPSVFIRRRILSVGSAICCPSVTFAVDNLPSPLFLDNMKCDLDWDAWERYSSIKGDFLYIPEILMRHRIHGDSETTALIEDSTRSNEDLEMFGKFWPSPIAGFISHIYKLSQNSNSL